MELSHSFGVTSNHSELLELYMTVLSDSNLTTSERKLHHSLAHTFVGILVLPDEPYHFTCSVSTSLGFIYPLTANSFFVFV